MPPPLPPTFQDSAQLDHFLSRLASGLEVMPHGLAASVDVAHVEPDPRALAQVPGQAARRFASLPLRRHGHLLAVAMARPHDLEALQGIGFLTDCTVIPLAADPQALEAALAAHYDYQDDLEVARQLGLDRERDPEAAAAADMERLAAQAPIIRMINDAIADAVSRRASDLHLRPGEHGTELLYRIDDELVPVRRFLPDLLPALVSRIKVLGRMNLAEHRTAQDGRTTFVLPDGRPVDLRISVLPSIHGESVAIRLLDSSQGLRSLDQIGLSPTDRQRIDDLLAADHGLFLVCGPAGFTFASAMRNFLRHDPDVIMVGEIRDRETAEIAIESALTGHLVLSTLHTNTAATAVTRLLDLGVEPYLLRASLLGAMSQRLVRRICPHCKARTQADPRIAGLLGLPADAPYWKGRGCAECEGLGMRGRTAAYELLTVSPGILPLVRAGAEADRIHAVAVQEGMVPLTATAAAMAARGEISLEEAFRARTD